MWPFTRKARLATDQEVIAALTKQAAALALLQEKHEALSAAHERLRGRVYATGLHKSPVAEEPPSPPAPRPKPSLVELGFVPGRPFNHK